MISNIAHLVVLMRVVFTMGCSTPLSSGIVALGTLVEDGLVSRQIPELLGLPGQAQARMFDMGMCSSSDLLHVELLAHCQVGLSVNLAPFSQVSGLFCIGDVDLLHPGPQGALGRHEDLVWLQVVGQSKQLLSV